MSHLKTTLKNMTNAKRIISKIIKDTPMETQFTDETLLELMNYHPRKEKVTDIEYFIIKLDETFKTPTLYIKTKTHEDSVSWNTCIINLFGKYDSTKDHILDVGSAFRLITFDNKHKEFVNAQIIDGVGICSHCKTACGKGKEKKFHVDHHIIPYIDIFNKFISENSINISSIILKKEGINYYLESISLAEKWKSYHNDRVTYRILCETCNMSFGCKSI